MTNNKKLTFLETLEKYKILLVFIGIIGIIFAAGGVWTNLQYRIFKTSAERDAAEEHNKNKLTDVEAYKMFLKWEEAQEKNIENKEDAIRSRRTRDSISLADREINRKRDSVMLDKINRMSVTQYQTKEAAESNKEEWSKYNASVEVENNN